MSSSKYNEVNKGTVLAVLAGIRDN